MQTLKLLQAIAGKTSPKFNETGKTAGHRDFVIGRLPHDLRKLWLHLRDLREQIAACREDKTRTDEGKDLVEQHDLLNDILSHEINLLFPAMRTMEAEATISREWQLYVPEKCNCPNCRAQRSRESDAPSMDGIGARLMAGILDGMRDGSPLNETLGYGPRSQGLPPFELMFAGGSPLTEIFGDRLRSAIYGGGNGPDDDSDRR